MYMGISNKLELLVKIMIVMWGTACISYAAEPRVDLRKGNKGSVTFSNNEDGPDILRVSHDSRIMIATGPCSSSNDSVSVYPTHQKGKSINGAWAFGRKKGDSVAYAVNGKFANNSSRMGVVKNKKTSEWTAEYGTPKIIILAVPEYLYANATADVPVKFQICRHNGTPMGKVKIIDLAVTFVCEGKEYIKKC